jgi:hypothetical protein
MLIRTGVAAIAGFAGGSLLAGFLVFGPLDIGGLRDGPWRTNLLIGDSEASPMSRAIIARRGLLAMNRSEAVYFNATSDDSGQRLDEDCAYRVTFVQEPDSRWWSLTLYAGDDYLAVNGDDAASVTADQAAASAENPMAVLVSASRPDGQSHWLSSRNAGDFALTLRLYQPAPAISDDPALAELPSIERLSCGGGS